MEAKCLDEYFVLVCVTGDAIIGPETLPGCWITYKVSQHCMKFRGLVDWKSDNANPLLKEQYYF